MEVVASTPKQTQIKDDIIKQQIIIDTMNKKKDLGMISEEEKKSLIHEQKLLTTLKKSLHLAEGNQKRQQKLRDERKRCIAELDEETQKKIKMKPSGELGRRKLVEDTDSLLKAICDIAIGGSAADERRRSTIIRSTRTLDDLTEAL